MAIPLYVGAMSTVNLSRPSGRRRLYVSLIGSDPCLLKDNKGDKLPHSGL